MKEYLYKDIWIGQEEKFSAVITEEKLRLFLQITEDKNPLHCDREFAKSQGFHDTVAYGMLTASFYSTLAGMHMPGKYSLLHSVDAKFLHPVYPGDILDVTGKVIDKNDTFQLITLKAEIRNQLGKKVSKAVIKAGVLNG